MDFFQELFGFIINSKVQSIWQRFPVKFRFTSREDTGRERDHVRNISVKIVRTCLSRIWSYSWNISKKSTRTMELNWYQSNEREPARQALTPLVLIFFWNIHSELNIPPSTPYDEGSLPR